METLKIATITTQRLRIRPITLEDVDFIYSMRSLREIYKWTIAGEWHDKSQATDWISTNLSNPNGFNYLIELLPNPSLNPEQNSSPEQNYTPIGSLGSPRPGEIGYMFHPTYWSKGYATESLTAFLKTYYQILGKGIGGVVAHTDAENVGSRRVLVKAGFKEVRREGWGNVTLGLRESVVFEFVPKQEGE